MTPLCLRAAALDTKFGQDYDVHVWIGTIKVFVPKYAMRAAVLEKFNEPLVVREFDKPALGPGEVLVRMLAAGVCGSDIHMWHGKDPRIPLPTIIGHEGVGEVEEIGPEPPKSISGRELRRGDRIAWDRGVTCGQCFFCAVRHEPNLCPNRWAYGIGRSSEKPPYLVGCYAEYIVLVRGTNIIHLDEFPSTDYVLLASTSCSGATAANAVEVAGIELGSAVLVQGSGPLGLFLTAFASMLGASPIVVVGGSPDSLSLALKLGADLVLSHRTTSSKERMEAIREIAPRGIDVVLESSGRPDSINEGIRALRTGGSYISTGFAVPGASVTIDCYQDLVRKNLRLQGVWTSHTRHLYQALALASQNPMLGEMITSTFTLEQATDALVAMEQREAIKSAIVF
ncbi:MAG: zinc-binding dehydrogenase [Armatimonadota bacterium]|nr:zinc-binding dehydrogenase [Armatimonadota bacterium]